MKPKKLTLSARLMLGYLTIALIASVVGMGGYFGLTSAVSNADAIQKKTKERGLFLAQSIDMARSAQVNFKKQVQAWKDILLRGRESTAFAKYQGEFDQQESLTQTNLVSLRGLMVAEGIDGVLVDDSIRTHGELGGKYRAALKSYDPTKADAAEVVDRLVKGIDRPATDAIDKIVAQVQKFDAETTRELTAQFHAQTQRTKFMTLVGILVGVAAAVSLGLFLSRSLSRQLVELATTLGHTSSEVSGAANEVASASQSLAEGASEQAASLQESSASLEELSSMTKRNAESAHAAKELAGQARQFAEKASSDMQGMSEAMLAIKTSSDNIAKIIKTIDEIAFQTNILALNAAVEAARAGTQGMGFAVVAQEVRSLAQRSAQAAKETAERIGDSITRSENGVLMNATVSEGLVKILEKVRKVDDLVAEMASASHEQSQGIQQINVAVSEMDKVTQHNAASAEESSSAAQELNAQADFLKEAVGDLLALVGNSKKQEAQGSDVAFKSKTSVDSNNHQHLIAH